MDDRAAASAEDAVAGSIIINLRLRPLPVGSFLVLGAFGVLGAFVTEDFLLLLLLL